MKKKALIITILTALLFSALPHCTAAALAREATAQTSSDYPINFLSLLMPFIPIIIILAAVIIIITAVKRAGRAASRWTSSTLSSLIYSLINKETAAQKQKQPVNNFSTNTLPKDNTLKIVSAVRCVDSSFMGEAFLTWANNVFITLQKALTLRDCSIIQPFEKEELFEDHKKLIDGYIKSNRINVRNSVSISVSYLHKYERDRQYEYLTVYMDTGMTDYIIDANTKWVISGNPNTLKQEKYLLTFIRKRGFFSNAECNRVRSKNCPNCGAALSMSNSSKCDFCGSIITNCDFDWVLSCINTLTPTTVIDNRGVVISD